MVGVDRSPEAVRSARARAAADGRGHVEFHQADDADLADRLGAGSFDAVVGRFVLVYQPDPVACLRRLAALLRPGGVAVLQEAQLAFGWHGGDPASPTLDRIWGWLSAACERAGLDVNMGLRLRRALLDAGSDEPEPLLTSRITGGPDSPAYEYLAESIRSLLLAMQKFGIADAGEVDIDTLAARLRDEVAAGGGAIAPSTLVGGSARWPGSPGAN